MYDLCIIGFGISGIAVMRQAKKHNINVIGLEKNSNIGGCWWEKSYPEVKLQSSKHTYSFSDYTYHDFIQKYPNRDDILDYLTQYCQQFKLFETVEFNSTVISTVHKQKQNNWEITYQQNNKKHTIHSTFLCCCSGIYSKPVIPNFINIKQYTGDIKHVSEWSYKGNEKVEDFKDKKIVIIGNGSSGCDMANLAVKYKAKSVTLLFKTNKWIFSRNNKLFSVQVLLNRSFMFLGNHLSENHIRYLLIIYSSVYLIIMSLVKGYKFTNISFPNKTISRNNVVINDSLYNLIGQKKINYLQGTIKQFNVDSIDFNIKKQIINYKPDLVIMATGYDKTIPFLQLEKPPVYLYNRILHPKFMSLGFIGFIMSVFWIQTSELQAKWFVQYIIGNINKPTKTQILSYLIKEQNYYKSHVSYDKYDYAFRSFDYCDLLANELQIEPLSSNNNLSYWLKPLYYNEWFS